MKIEQLINLKFLVKLGKNYYENGQIIDALLDSHFTENERSRNKQVVSICNGDRFLLHRKRYHD
jgi:hypothetical protein